MTVHLENGAATRSNPITMLPRFPAGMLGASLLGVIQSAVDGVVVVDAARQIVLVNHRAEHIFGYSANLLLERSLDTLIPARSVGEARRRVERLASPRAYGRRTKLDLRGVRSDGNVLALKASISRVTVHGDIFLALIVHEASPLHVFTQPSLPAVLVPSVRRWAVSTQQASEVEKRRFSRKLYDDIGQRLSVLKLDLDWLENSLPGTNQYIPQRLAEMQGLLDNVITLTKSMASTLRPPVLDDFGLLPALEWMVESFRKRTAINCILESGELDHKLDDAVESAVFRVIQEGLANMERHSHATQAIVSVRRAGPCLEVLIRDDGVGMEGACLSKPGCYGLIAMQERVFVLGGTIRIENVRPHGLQIRASIPVEQNYSTESNLPTSSPAHDPYRNCR